MAASDSSMKRKRNESTGDSNDAHTRRPLEAQRPAKRARNKASETTKHALLDLYYPCVRTLREYVLAKLPKTSRIRYRKIASVGSKAGSSGKEPTEVEAALGRFLDTTLLGLTEDVPLDTKRDDNRWEQWVSFSQKGDESYVTLSDGARGALLSQAEIVDFVIWLLFSREKIGSWPKHILCDGFRRNISQNARPQGGQNVRGASIPGLFSVYPNSHVQAVKEDPWPQLLQLLGKAGERIMIDLLLDCAVFTAVAAGRGNLYQLSGIPMSELKTLETKSVQPATGAKGSAKEDGHVLSPCEITFVKSRMMYARAALNARGLVHFGLRHIHVLNRFPLGPKKETTANSQPVPSAQDAVHPNTTHVMMYMFPRQFGLHNVFTSAVDRKQTAQKFQDYTLREEEILAKFTKTVGDAQTRRVFIPKRLKGKAVHLVQRFQVLHGRCSYLKLLQHYCPAQEQFEAFRNSQPSSTRAQGKGAKKRKPRQSLSGQPEMKYATLVDVASPVSDVSAFCRAVFGKTVPDEFWGTGSVQEENKKNFLQKVDTFIRLRQFENLNLHDLLQGLKMAEIEWLAPPGLQNQKCSQTDLKKRTEIFCEFLYYLFDSILIPLIRSNFYVTESNVHRYRLFYFRHDVWRYVAEPAMASLKAKMFEEVKVEDAMRILEKRSLGFSQVRLLPKDTTMRPIMNLRRRTLDKGKKNMLGPSINQILGPVNSVLKLERELKPELLGSAMFSVSEIYGRIKSFKAQHSQYPRKRFFFAKVDVKAAFDTIPQEAVVALMKTIPGESQYKIGKHVEVQPAANTHGSTTGTKATRKWHPRASTVGGGGGEKGEEGFPALVERRLAGNRTDTVFVDSVVQRFHRTGALAALLETHVRENLVRIGKKFYRQRDGIPQGSVLSSALCNYFYADLEAKHLAFLKEADENKNQNPPDSLLLRLIDDFLLITTDEAKAARFVRTMHAGVPAYGVGVSPAKTLVNFDLQIGGTRVARAPASSRLPYCGTLIDCATLDVAKDREHARDPVIFNSLTVEASRYPGQNFRRKVLNAFKIQSHLMFYDTAHNAPRTVLRNIYAAFVETATKMWAYARCLGRPRAARPSAGLVMDTIRNLIDVAFVLLTSRTRKARHPGYECAVTKAQVSWLAMVACRQVLAKKQAAYAPVVAWLEAETRQLSARKDATCRALVRAVRGL